MFINKLFKEAHWKYYLCLCSIKGYYLTNKTLTRQIYYKHSNYINRERFFTSPQWNITAWKVPGCKTTLYIIFLKILFECLNTDTIYTEKQSIFIEYNARAQQNCSDLPNQKCKVEKYALETENNSDCKIMQ